MSLDKENRDCNKRVTTGSETALSLFSVCNDIFGLKSQERIHVTR